ncbi:hypothetical protein BDN72DRAFT_740143, partial [Pluteus cervinus]
DLFYGQEALSQICHRFITFLFTCPDHPPTPVAANNTQARLPYFITYTLHHTKLNEAVTYAILILLQRLKARFSTTKALSSHRLFISAIMIIMICNNTYSNKSPSFASST